MFEYKTVEFIGSHNYPLTMADRLDVCLKKTIPNTFNIDNFAMTVKKFDNLIKPDECWQIWEELEKWQSNKDNLIKLFLENDCDIVKFYSNKQTNNNIRKFATLLPRCLHFHILALKLNVYFLN